MLLLQCLINQQVQSQERALTIGHVCAWADKEAADGGTFFTQLQSVTLQVTPTPTEDTGSSLL